MASLEAKAKRKAIALNELDRLSGMLGKHLKIEMPSVRVTNRDPELQGIQRVEAINELLARVLGVSGVEAQPETEEPVDLEHMKKADLLGLAKSKNLDVDSSFTKSELIEALNA